MAVWVCFCVAAQAPLLHTRVRHCHAHTSCKCLLLTTMLHRPLPPVLPFLFLPQVLLRKDFDMLSSFRQDAACRVTLGGQTYEPR